MNDNKNSAACVWIAWQQHRRTTTLTQALDVPLVVIETPGLSSLRYPISLIKTIAILVKRRPKTLFVQNPSLVLAVFAVLWGKLRLSTVIVDAHNAGVTAWPDSSTAIQYLTRFALRHANLTLVTNEVLANKVTEVGGRARVLPDRMPAFKLRSRHVTSGSTPHVVFVCTYSRDEPVGEVIAAARLLPDAEFSVTGKPTASFTIANQPANLTLTGYLSDDDYIALLARADVIIDLTTREACLVCGAYEATALGQPVLLSDNAASRALFPGALFCDNTASSIAGAISEFVKAPDLWRSHAIAMRAARSQAQDVELTEIKAWISESQ